MAPFALSLVHLTVLLNILNCVHPLSTVGDGRPVELLFLLQNPTPTTLFHSVLCISDILLVLGPSFWSTPESTKLELSMSSAGSPTLGPSERLILGKAPFDPQHCLGQYPLVSIPCQLL